MRPWTARFLAIVLTCMGMGGALAQPRAPAVVSSPLERSSQIVGGTFEYTVRPGDTLTAIGARFGESASSIIRRNDLGPRAPIHPGQALRIDNRHIVPQTLDDGILINLPQRMLFDFREGRLVNAYPVGLGKPSWPTPTGRFKVIELRRNPVWHVPLSIQEEMRREGKAIITRMPPGPDNPLGQYWIGLSLPGYGIHGTSAPPSVYHFQSHGCIRLHPEDIETLFDKVELGTPGKIIYARLLLAELPDGRIELEVHPDIYRQQSKPMEMLEKFAAEQGLTDRIDWAKAKLVIQRQEGLAQRIDRQPEASALSTERKSP